MNSAVNREHGSVSLLSLMVGLPIFIVFASLALEFAAVLQSAQERQDALDKEGLDLLSDQKGAEGSLEQQDQFKVRRLISSLINFYGSGSSSDTVAIIPTYSKVSLKPIHLGIVDAAGAIDPNRDCKRDKCSALQVFRNELIRLSEESDWLFIEERKEQNLCAALDLTLEDGSMEDRSLIFARESNSCERDYTDSGKTRLQVILSKEHAEERDCNFLTDIGINCTTFEESPEALARAFIDSLRREVIAK